MKHGGQIKMKIILILMAISICVTEFSSNLCYAGAPVQTDQQESVKKACLKATITAIKMDRAKDK
jgi:hypothetical protein